MNENAPVDIDRSVYFMPVFANFVVSDLAAAQEFYHAMGFATVATIPGPDGSPQLVHLRRLRYQDILLIPGRPSAGTVSMTYAAGGEDLAGLADRVRKAAVAGAEIEGPYDSPWFTTDVTIDDPDGNRITLTEPRTADRDEAMEWAKSFDTSLDTTAATFPE